MSPNRIKRSAVAGVAAVLCFGFGAPAGAHVAPSRSEPVAEHTFQPPTFAQVRSYLDTIINAKIARLDAVAARVAADPLLSADQKARFAAKVARIRQNLVNLKAAIDAATSNQQVHDILIAAYPGLFFPGRPHHLRFHHRDPDRAGQTRAAVLPASVIRHDRAFDPRFAAGCHHGAGDPDGWQRYGAQRTFGPRRYTGFQYAGFQYGGGFRYGGGFHHR